MSEQVNRKCPPSNATVRATFNFLYWPWGLKLSTLQICNAVLRSMHTLHAVPYARVMHMQIMWYVYIIFSQSKFPKQYNRQFQHQLGFLLKQADGVAHRVL